MVNLAVYRVVFFFKKKKTILRVGTGGNEMTGPGPPLDNTEGKVISQKHTAIQVS